jgi:hypothetical protein
MLVAFTDNCYLSQQRQFRKSLLVWAAATALRKHDEDADHSADGHFLINPYTVDRNRAA